MPRLDPKSLAELRQQAEAIPPQPAPRAEQNRLRLLAWVRKLEKEQCR